MKTFLPCPPEEFATSALRAAFAGCWHRILHAGFYLLIGAMLSVPVKADEYEFFEKKIRPLLAERCYKCHSGEAEKLKGELFLDTKEGMLKGGESGKPAIVPGKPEGSLLIEAIGYKNEDLQMPPPKSGRLNDEQIADLTEWVKLGAPDPRTKVAAKAAPLADKYKEARTHWAFQPVKNPPVPEITGTASRTKPPAGSSTANNPLTPID